MTDRELLEAAAKAAGIDLTWDDHGNPGYWSDWKGLPQWTPWNPREDNGDALRLAVKLRMAMDIEEYYVDAFVHVWQVNEREEINGDPYAATRRAIVRAAAAIGGAKP